MKAAEVVSCLALVSLAAPLLSGCASGEQTANLVRLQGIGSKSGTAGEEDYRFALERLERGGAEERAAAAWVLGRIGWPAAVPALRRAAREDGDPFVRVNALTALGPMEGEEIQDTLVAALSDENADVQAAALGAIADPRYGGASAVVAELLLSGGETVRARAAEALAVMGARDALPVLERAAGDGDNQVRSSAAFAMGKIGDPACVPVLLGLLEDEAWDVRANAAQALGMIGDPAVRPRLELLLEDPHEQVRAVAERALGRLG